jgi:hypothetical protein
MIMQDVLLYFFKNKPEVINTYYKYRSVMINVVLFGVIATAILAKSDLVRSLSLGMASGIVLVNIGESISRLRGNGSKKLQAGSESVNV